MDGQWIQLRALLGVPDARLLIVYGRPALITDRKRAAIAARRRIAELARMKIRRSWRTRPLQITWFGALAGGCASRWPGIAGRKAEQGRLPGEVPCSCWMNLGLFRAASLQTGRARFRASGFPAIYAACATGFAWIQSWHAAQTTRVLRRVFAMSAAHAGWPGPGSPSALRPVTWWTATVVPVSHSSHSRLRSRLTSSLRG